MELIRSNIENLFTYYNKNSIDFRGAFIKVFQKSYFKDIPKYDVHEQYFSISKKNVIRGMHFQERPFDHSKIVTCVKGKALDVIIDLRKSSSSFLEIESFEISSDNKLSIFIPPGCAHGFLSLEEDTILLYNVSSEYSPKHDTGIHYNSFGFNWPINKPIVSERDDKLVFLSEYKTKFI